VTVAVVDENRSRPFCVLTRKLDWWAGEVDPMRFFKAFTVLACCCLVAALSATAGGTMLKVEKTNLGKVVANSKGHTLYMFRADKGTKSACYGKCATFWPPLLTSGKPVAGPGIKAALLGTTKRTDGKLQVTYKNHPVYTFLEDTKAGQTKGEGSKAFGAGWYALTPTGVVIDRG
jgi:predicted lipoprotein with Yx(FWY)xxD motif